MPKLPGSDDDKEAGHENFQYQILRENFELEPGFKPHISSLALFQLSQHMLKTST